MKPQYLRLSVTGRCRLHCLYCRPAGSPQHDLPEELSVRQVRLLTECAAAEGVRKIRITGGEPLERDDLEEIIRAISSVPGVEETVMTTNGVALLGRCRLLKKAGLRRINVSLDTLRPERFLALTGTDAHERVMAGIAQARAVFGLVKTNAVLLRGRNDDEIEDFVRFAGETGTRVRFVEYYPTCHTTGLMAAVPAAEVLRRIELAFGRAVPMARDPLSIEMVYRVPSAGNATVGIIPSATDPPCAQCTKLRVTASGTLVSCLFASTGVPLRPLLVEDDAAGLRAAIRQVFAWKKQTRPRARLRAAAWQIGG